MVSLESPAVDTISIPPDIAEKVLTIGLEHKPYKGGIGYLMHVYSQYFPVFKYVTTYRMLPGKAALCLYFAKQYLHFVGLLVRDRTLDIVHIHGASYGSFYRKFIIFLTAKYVFRKRTIYHVHGSEFQVFYENSNALGKRLIRFMIGQTDVVICLSTFWESFFNANFTMKRIEVLANVVEVAPQRDRLFVRNTGNGPLKVLFLGLLGKRKGIYDLLDLLGEHQSELAGRLELTIGGNGETEAVQQYIIDHDLGAMVHFDGWVTGIHKQRLLAESDVYILPSYNEGLPMAILEAMSYDLPIISTPVGGTAEVVRDGINGYLIQPGDQQAMYERLTTLLANPALALEMGRQSGQLIRSYLPAAILPRLQAIYENLLRQPA